MPADASVQQLIKSVYPSFDESDDRDRLFESRAILAPLNRTVDDINSACIELFPGDSRQYRSVDSVPDADAATQFPPELLNQLNPSGLPQHLLELKVGMPVMLLRNLDAPRLCNGTRLLLTRLSENLLEARIACGEFRGETVFLPRIPLQPSSADLPVRFWRLQFPIRPCFAMTIHKSQGQSLEALAVDLTMPCFHHGQLYVALSRARDPARVKVRAPGGRTRNIVLRQLLQHL